MQSAIKHIKKRFICIYLHIIHICKTIANLCKYYLLCVLMHQVVEFGEEGSFHRPGPNSITMMHVFSMRLG